MTFPLIESCPICAHPAAHGLFTLPASPLVPAIPRDHAVGEADFACLDVVACDGCGHIFNRAYADELAERMYGESFLTNMPVQVTMFNAIVSVASWIGEERYAGKRVIEIGAGSGHLARIVARKAAQVRVFEPCKGLRPEMLPEANIELVNAPFEAPAHDGRAADLIVCRQVIEHLASPSNFIADIVAALRPDGYAYLEVPDADFIVDNNAFNDLHLAHVQYFNKAHFTDLARRHGLTMLAVNPIKDGHDFGMLFQLAADAAGDVAAPSRINVPSDLGSRLSEARATAKRRLACFDGALGIYGATWQSQSLVSAMGADKRFAAAFDDNAHFDGAALHGGGYKIPISQPSLAGVAAMDVIVIGAYLHDRVIARKLRDMGFTGKIVSANPKSTEFDGLDVESLYAGHEHAA